MGIYAWATKNPPLPRYVRAGCPASGWLHEGAPPWRVITTTSPTFPLISLRVAKLVPYIGDEKTVDVEVWLADCFNPLVATHLVVAEPFPVMVTAAGLLAAAGLPGWRDCRHNRAQKILVVRPDRCRYLCPDCGARIVVKPPRGGS